MTGWTRVPAALRQRATWRMVWRFLWAGPLIGGLPYNWMLFPIPFAYLFGAVPAAVAGLLFGMAVYGGSVRWPSWRRRAVLGALCGAGAVAAVGLGTLIAGGRLDTDLLTLVALHGIPAAIVLALMQRAPTAAIAQRR